MMFNLTGLIETDLLLIEIIKNTQHSKKPYLDFKSVLMKNKIPYNFLNIFKYFFKVISVIIQLLKLIKS